MFLYARILDGKFNFPFSLFLVQLIYFEEVSRGVFI